MLALLPYIQAAVSVLLVIGILLQRSEAGLGAAFGADGMSGTRYSRRGSEKVLFNATIALAVLFAILSFVSLFFR